MPWKLDIRVIAMDVEWNELHLRMVVVSVLTVSTVSPFYRFGIALVLFCFLFPFRRFSQRSVSRTPFPVSGAALRAALKQW